ncbi:N-acetylmuramoyl-L-alanine amidase [Sulfitobacter sp. 1151]|uniref:N-acetylmuramoyl-L-alanine amidase n=1 Tax=Parasulfitobacter algicola TaxID=2614809 RepID=A0ABX2IJZ9_9RHOB|nr:N-acetylmuramoyl-L-alanine amidase [Sulfitobacter algicola]NSX53194.1 N-acetylmuramoyl-L-alanine amidase [Sulfitobacter algicola]
MGSGTIPTVCAKLKRISHPSPNFGPRRGGARISLIVLHYTAMPSATEAVERLCDAQHEVSAHYLIAESGTIYDMVDDAHRAWHAGAGSWRGCDDVNSQSIGIELANDGASPFAAPLMTALESLLAQLMQKYEISPVGVIGHSDMAPDRKSDPGRRFDWRRLALQRLAVWPVANDPIAIDDAVFQQNLQRFGYPDASLSVLLDAFRQRFRPAANGALDGQDMAMSADLAHRFGVDPAPGTA